VIVPIGGEKVVTCEPTGGSSVTWRKGNTAITSNTRHLCDCGVEGNGVTLRFTNFTQSSAGNYKCSYGGLNSRSCPFQVIEPGKLEVHYSGAMGVYTKYI